MEPQTFTINVPWTFPVGIGVMFGHELDGVRKRVTITGYTLVPINSETAYVEGIHIYVRSEHSPSGRFPIAYFSANLRHFPDNLNGVLEFDLRHRYLVGYDEDSASEWAEGFMQEWNEKEMARKEVEA